MRPLAVLPLTVLLLLAGCAAPTPDAPQQTLSPGCDDISLQLQQRKSNDLDAYDIVATNDGDATCTLSGYPAVEVLGTDGEVVGAAPEVDVTTTIESVTLEPGGVAYALVELERGEAECESADTAGLRVTLPGSTEPVVLDDVRVLFCPAGDDVRAGAFRSEPLEDHELRPDS
jgi:hypothetical protein